MGARRRDRGQRVIPPLSLLPEPDRLGETDDGWTSRVWQRGRHGLRIRHLEKRAVMNVFEDGKSVQKFTGDLEFVVQMAQPWFEARRNEG